MFWKQHLRKAYLGHMKGGRFFKSVLQTTFEKGSLGPHEGRKVSQRYFVMFRKGLLGRCGSFNGVT
jgi:hypothetical protein